MMLFIVLTTLAVGLAVPAPMIDFDMNFCKYNEKIYQPNDSFEDECNTCICHDSGQVACTIMLCTPAPPAEPECLYLGPDGSTMRARGSYYDGCNSCTCSPTGQSACTMMSCPHKCHIVNDDGPSGWVHPNTVVKKPEADTSCPTVCKCKDNGLGACTMISCPPPECHYVGPDGSTMPAWGTYNDGCNTCRCSFTGRSACTRMACPHKCYIVNDDGHSGWVDLGTVIIKAETASSCAKVCKCQDNGLLECTTTSCPPAECHYAGSDGSTMPAWGEYNDGCNSCTCSSTGPPACTRMACPHKCYIVNDDGHSGWVDLGTVIIKAETASSCKVCKCKEINGRLACTMMSCPQAECHYAGSDGSTKSVLAGGSYNDGCNWCGCSPEPGHSWCTMMACLHVCHIVNADGHSGFVDLGTVIIKQGTDTSCAEVCTCQADETWLGSSPGMTCVEKC